MLKKVKNNKGFTLIELLAVIVILGILMIVAIPQVTKYIEQSKKDTFIDTAKAYINAARYAYLNDEFTDVEGCVLGTNAEISLGRLEVDNSGKSPFGGDLQGYITIIAKEVTSEKNENTNHYEYIYYATIKDSKKNWGISAKESELTRKNMEITDQNFRYDKNEKVVKCDSAAISETAIPNINK